MRNLVFDVEEANALKLAFRKHGWSNEQIRLLTELPILKEFRAVLEGTMRMIPIGVFINVDRSIRPAYPEWVVKMEYPELEATGPTQFEAGKLEQWRHPKQENGPVASHIIQKYHEQHDMLVDDLSLRDLEEIRAMGIFFFRKYFRGRVVFGCKSLTRQWGFTHSKFPYLREEYGRVELGWRSTYFDWKANDVALRFPKSAVS